MSGNSRMSPKSQGIFWPAKNARILFKLQSDTGHWSGKVREKSVIFLGQGGGTR